MPCDIHILLNIFEVKLHELLISTMGNTGMKSQIFGDLINIKDYKGFNFKKILFGKLNPILDLKETSEILPIKEKRKQINKYTTISIMVLTKIHRSRFFVIW